jgi:hypothetical protein
VCDEFLVGIDVVVQRNSYERNFKTKKKNMERVGLPRAGTFRGGCKILKNNLARPI